MNLIKLEIAFVDTDGLGAEEAIDVIENNHYPNHCLNPHVLGSQVVDIGEWDDDHPLNQLSAWPGKVREVLAAGEYSKAKAEGD